ncbi:hypothetical protein CRUP_021931 [Coryphaenoides rupestris]|nr:hypothetical protein CRUP_021931 [Coryphaenoides rupestris]
MTKILSSLNMTSNQPTTTTWPSKRERNFDCCRRMETGGWPSPCRAERRASSRAPS